MHKASQREQQLLGHVLPRNVGQLMRQHIRGAVRSLPGRNQQHRAQDACHHRAVHQRRGKHTRALPLRQSVTPALGGLLCRAAHAQPPHCIPAKLPDCRRQHPKCPQGRQYIKAGGPL